MKKKKSEIASFNSRKLASPYLKNIAFKNCSLSAIFQAARLDSEAGSDVWADLENTVNLHILSKCVDARRAGYKKAFDEIGKL